MNEHLCCRPTARVGAWMKQRKILEQDEMSIFLNVQYTDSSYAQRAEELEYSRRPLYTVDHAIGVSITATVDLSL